MSSLRGTLELCNRWVPGTPLRIWIGGASNARGQNAQTGNPATAGFTMPANLTLYEDGVLQASYPTDHHGAEVGIMDELETIGFTDDVIINKQGVPGSSLPGWKSTYCAELISYYEDAGIPLCGLFIHGGNDSTTDNLSSAYLTNLLDFAAIMRRDIGGGMGFVIVKSHIVDEEEFPFSPVVQNAQETFATESQGLRLIDPIDLVAELSEDSHWSGVAQREFGRRFVRHLVADGIIILP